jgi:hypothetical protein
MLKIKLPDVRGSFPKLWATLQIFMNEIALTRSFADPAFGRFGYMRPFHANVFG